MRNIFIILLFIFNSNILFCQDTFTMSGFVYDKNTNNPIKFVNISVKNTGLGTVTDNNGFFNLSFLMGYNVLIFTHIGYKTLIMRLDTINDLTSLHVLMIPIAVPLKEVNIYSKRKNINKYNSRILDYNFKGDTIVVLNRINNKNFQILLLKNLFDTITKLELPSYYKFTAIFKDCLYNIHLIGKDSVYQLQICKKKISISYIYDRNLFTSIMGDCIMFTTNYLLFKKEFKDTYYTEYYAISKINKTIKTFITLDETNKEKETTEYIKWLIKNGFTGDIAARIRFEKEIMRPPSFQPIFKLLDSIYYMNHINNRIDVYDSDLHYINSRNTKYSLLKGWKPIFLVDMIKKKIYTVYKRHGHFYISKINIITGQLDYEKKISIPFPQKPKINNGYFYCIFNDYKGGKKLYRTILN